MATKAKPAKSYLVIKSFTDVEDPSKTYHIGSAANHFSEDRLKHLTEKGFVAETSETQE